MKQELKERIEEFTSALIDQKSAKVIVDPNSNSKGFGLGEVILFFTMQNITYLAGIATMVIRGQV